jgi:transcriptional regulator with XRE-family HTH domain
VSRALRTSFGEAVRSVRQEQGISQEELAHRARLHRNHVGEIERAEVSPTLDTIELIATALNIRPSELIARAEAGNG